MKKRTMITYAVAGLMTVGTTLHAEEPADGPGGRGPQGGQNLSPEERAAKRKESQEKMQAKLEELRKKKTDGTITDEESKQLAKMEEMSKRVAPGGPGQGGQGGPKAQGRQGGPDGQGGGPPGGGPQGGGPQTGGPQGGGRGGPFQNLSPEERDAKMKEMSEKGEKRLTELLQKKKDGKLSEEETQQFSRLATIAQMMAEGHGPGTGRGGRPPGPSPGDQPPPPPVEGK